MSGGEVLLRPATPKDKHFLRELYCVSRDYEVAGSDLPEAKLKAFLRQQFALQQKHYDKTYPEAERNIIVFKGEDIGRFDVNFHAVKSQYHLLDITLQREYRGFQIGKKLLLGLMNRARDNNASVTLNVHIMNPAQSFYKNLGFSPLAVNQQHLLMQWQCSPH